MDVIGIAILILMLLGSVIVWVQWIRICRRRSIAQVIADCRQHRRQVVTMPLSAAATIWLLWILIPPATAEFMMVPPIPSLRTVQAGCTAHGLLLLCATLVMISTMGHRQAWQHAPREWRGDLYHGLRGFLASCLPVFLTLWATHALRSEESQHSYLKLIAASSDASVLAWIVLAAVLLAPLVEELVFRVVLQPVLVEWCGEVWGVCGVAVLFAGIHGWPDALPLIPLALVLGVYYRLRGSYLTVVVIHMLFNAGNLLLALSSTTTTP